MGSRKAKRRLAKPADKAIEEETHHKDSPFAFETLISALQSPQGINQSLLKRCYLLLNHISAIPQCSMRYGAELNDCNEETGNDWHNLVMEDISRVSDLLFKELSERFEQCFSSLFEEDDSFVSVRWDSFAIVNLLLRCCSLLLTLQQINQEYLFQKGQIVLGILRQLRSMNFEVKKVNKGIRFERSVSSACGDVEAGYAACSTDDFVASLHFFEPSSSCLHFVSAMLEVFVDELLMHGPLRSILKLIDSFVPTSDILCLALSGHDNIGVLFEVMCDHFSLAFSDDQALEDLLNGLFGMGKKKFIYSSRPFEVSPSAATLLLLNPIIFSAPKFMQAHIIAFVSEAISNSSVSENLKPDCRLMNCLLTVLEKSVILYTKHIPNLQSDKFSNDFLKSANAKESQPPFESFITQDTRNRINCLIAELDDYPVSYLSNVANKTKTNTVSSAIRYVRECQDVFDKPFQDEIFSILSRIVIETSDGLKYAVSNSSEIGCLQDLCILASLLKLISTALLNAVSFMRYDGDQNHPKCLSDSHWCKEYEILSSTIGCFGSCGSHFLIQQFLCNMMNTSSTRHKNSKMMFLHFSGLLSLGLSTGLEFLMKGSLSIIMALMNLFVFEEGNLDVFVQLYGSGSEPFPYDPPSVSIHETFTDKKFSRVVASKFLRTRTLYSRYCERNCSMNECESSPNVGAESPSDIMGAALGVEEQTEETSNGEVFLKCILKHGKKVRDFNDLAEFIECKQGKDYSSWLRSRRKYRMWKDQKMAILRWKRKKQTWRIAKSKKPLDGLKIS